jgi:hypothetical protein
MLRTFLVTVMHHNKNGDNDVRREHRVYMPDKEYDKSGARYRNERWVEESLEKKIGPKYNNDGSYVSNYWIQRIRQER